jgi:hydrogenase maturation protease
VIVDEVLVLGIGNVLMGDEGVGVHVVQHLEQISAPTGVRYLDGGTGSFLLLEPIQQARRVILIDATVDGNAPGTVRRLRPRFSSDYPATLTAHDIGLKDLLDAAYLTGGQLDVILLAVSIDLPKEVGTELSPVIAECVPQVAEMVVHELQSCRSHLDFT